MDGTVCVIPCASRKNSPRKSEAEEWKKKKQRYEIKNRNENLSSQPLKFLDIQIINNT